MTKSDHAMAWQNMPAFLLWAALSLFHAASAANELEPLTLAQAVETALENNPGLGASRFETAIRSLEKDVAQAQHYPVVELNASYRHYSDPSLVYPLAEAGQFPPLAPDVINTGLSLRLPLYAGGKLVAAEQLATYQEQEAVGLLRQNEQDLIFNVVSTYTRALQLNDLFRAQSQRLRSLAAQVDELERKQQAGRVIRLDVLRVRSQLSRAKVDHAATAQGEQDALNLLAALLNLPAINRKLEPTPYMELTVPGSAQHLSTLAHKQNPRVAQARAQLESAKAQLEMARGERRLQVDLLANVQTRRDDEWEGRDDWDIGVAIKIPVFDAGVRRSRIDQANARRLRSQQALNNTLNEISAEAYAALGNLNTAGAQADAARDALEEAKEAMHIESRRYRTGRSAVTDLLSAESALWSAIAAHNQAMYDGFVAQVRLLRAVGELKPNFFKGSGKAGTVFD